MGRIFSPLSCLACASGTRVNMMWDTIAKSWKHGGWIYFLVPIKLILWVEFQTVRWSKFWCWMCYDFVLTHLRLPHMHTWLCLVVLTGLPVKLILVNGTGPSRSHPIWLWHLRFWLLGVEWSSYSMNLHSKSLGFWLPVKCWVYWSSYSYSVASSHWYAKCSFIYCLWCLLFHPSVFPEF